MTLRTALNSSASVHIHEYISQLPGGGGGGFFKAEQVKQVMRLAKAFVQQNIGSGLGIFSSCIAIIC
jgi:hypothetical protein